MTDERVAARLEPEAEEVRKRDEQRLPALTNERVDVRRRRVTWRSGVLAAIRFRAAPLALGQLPDEVLLEGTPVAVVDGRAVDFERTADEEAVPEIPGVVAPLAPEGRAGRTAQVHPLALVEDVLLESLPVFVAPLQHLAHHDIKVGLRPERDCADRARHGDDGESQACESSPVAAHEWSGPIVLWGCRS